MLECLLASGRLAKPILPSYTGPGPQELIGYYAEDMGPGTEKGFFGEVPVSELISGNDLATLIGLTGGTAQNTNSPWLKFYLDGRILFVAKQPYRHSISWDQINAVDAVEGSRRIEIRSNPYLIGLLEGIGKDHSVIGTGYDHPLTHGSEWNRLMYNVALPLATNDIRDSQVGDNWANYDQAGVADGLWTFGTSSNGTYSWCKEVWPTNTTRRVARGTYGVSRSNDGTSSSTNSAFGWRPCLELDLTPYPPELLAAIRVREQIFTPDELFLEPDRFQVAHLPTTPTLP